MAKKLSHWLNIGLQKIQTAQEEKCSQTTAAVAALKRQEQEQSQQQEPGQQEQSSSPAFKVGSTAAGGPAAGGDAASDQELIDSDADEINDALFDVKFVEIPASALGVSVPADVLTSTPSSTDGWHQESCASNGSEQQQQQQQDQKKKHKQPAVVAYINWGSSIVSSGLASRANLGSGGGGDSETAPDKEAHTVAADRLSTEAHYMPAGGHTAEVLEQLMMPELDPSMAPFLRWRTRPRFVVPARLVAVVDSSKAGQQHVQQ
jgi:hypothetical protein